MVEQQLVVEGARAPRRGGGRRAAGRARARPRPLGGALEPRLRRVRTGHTLVRVDLRGRRPLARGRARRALARAVGGGPRRRRRAASGSSGRRSSGTRSAPASRSSSRSSGPTLCRRARADRRRGRPLQPRPAHARLRRADRGAWASRRGSPSSGRRTRRSRRRRWSATRRSWTSTATCCSTTIPVDYVRQCRAIAGAESLSGRLGEIGHPVLVVVGGLDDRTAARARPRARPRASERAARRAAGGRPLDPARGAGGDRGGGRGVPRGARRAALRRRRARPARGHDAAQLAGRARSATSTCAGSSARRPVRR